MIQRIVIALNTVGSQTWAFMTLLLGCCMYGLALHLHADLDLSKELITIGSTLFTAQATKTFTSQPSGQNESTETSQVVETPEARFQTPVNK